MRLGYFFAIATLGYSTAALALHEPLANPFSALTVYDGNWIVRVAHPWSGAHAGTADRLLSRCHVFTLYFACEQTVNGKTASLLVYTAGSDQRHLFTRMIAPDGLAGGRGSLTLSDPHWTYLDKPPAPLKGNWSRVENFVIDRDHIQFEEFTSADEGKTWTEINSGSEERRRR